MLSTMREKTKIIMLVLAVAFVGWLVFDVGMGVSGRGKLQTQDIGSVDGAPIRYQSWLDAYRSAYEEARQQNPGQIITREDQRAIEDEAFERLVQGELLQAQYRRRGIVVTDREIGDAVRRFPPREITGDPQFQTDSQFDPQKYERFLTQTTASRPYLLEMERRFREELPRLKLLEDVTSDIYVSDGRLWAIWRDQHDSATIRALVIRPREVVADASIHVTDADVQAYYDAHKDDFSRPARARVSFIAVIKLPTPVDSAEAMARARALRDSILHGADFAAIARSESADSGSRAEGGELPIFTHGRMVPAFEEAAFRLPVGQVSEPVVSPFGVHLIKVERRTADSVKARHILIPVARSGARLDTLEARADSLDRLAAEQTSAGVLDSIARLMSLSVVHPEPIYEGTPYVLGRFRIPDVGVWAFEAKPGETSPVVETNGAFYVFRLDSLSPAGVPPLAEVREAVTLRATQDKKRAAAEAIAHDAERRLNGGQSLDQVAAALHLVVTTLGPFTRTGSVPALGTASEAIGVAFRLRVGERSRLLSNADAFFFIEPARRTAPDSAAWVTQKEQQRLAVLRAARQARVQAYMESLRRQAVVKDRRAEVLRPAA
jgi:peptidyl-prolyl cis-trans isomerase D